MADIIPLGDWDAKACLAAAMEHAEPDTKVLILMTGGCHFAANLSNAEAVYFCRYFEHSHFIEGD